MPTALQLGPSGWQRYLRTGRLRNPPATPTASERQERESLLTRVREAAGALKQQFGVRKVVLFGSLSHRAWYTSDANVDLAVEGLSARDYWQAWKVVEDIIGDRSVDIVEFERAKTSLRLSIIRSGTEL